MSARISARTMSRKRAKSTWPVSSSSCGELVQIPEHLAGVLDVRPRRGRRTTRATRPTSRGRGARRGAGAKSSMKRSSALGLRTRAPQPLRRAFSLQQSSRSRSISPERQPLPPLVEPLHDACSARDGSQRRQARRRSARAPPLEASHRRGRPSRRVGAAASRSGRATRESAGRADAPPVDRPSST